MCVCGGGGGGEFLAMLKEGAGAHTFVGVLLFFTCELEALAILKRGHKTFPPKGVRNV